MNNAHPQYLSPVEYDLLRQAISHMVAYNHFIFVKLGARRLDICDTIADIKALLIRHGESTVPKRKVA